MTLIRSIIVTYYLAPIYVILYKLNITILIINILSDYFN